MSANNLRLAYILAFTRQYHQLPMGPPSNEIPVVVTYYDIQKARSK